MCERSSESWYREQQQIIELQRELSADLDEGWEDEITSFLKKMCPSADCTFNATTSGMAAPEPEKTPEKTPEEIAEEQAKEAEKAADKLRKEAERKAQREAPLSRASEYLKKTTEGHLLVRGSEARGERRSENEGIHQSNLGGRL